MVTGVGPAFTAAYTGECADCGNMFDEGEEAGFVDDEVVCGACRDAAETERRHSGDR